MQLYKITTLEGACLNGGSGTWPLPPDDETPGEWWEISGELVPCQNGLHLASLGQLKRWLSWRTPQTVIFRAQTEGRVIEADGKFVARKVRLLPGFVYADEYMATQTDYSYAQYNDHDLGVKRPSYGTFELAKLTVPKGHTLERKIERAKKKIDSYNRQRTKAIRRKQDEAASKSPLLEEFFRE